MLVLKTVGLFLLTGVVNGIHLLAFADGTASSHRLTARIQSAAARRPAAESQTWADS